MDNIMIYLFYLLVLALFATLIWFFIRQGGDPADPSRGMRNGNGGHPETSTIRHPEIEENGDE